MQVLTTILYIVLFLVFLSILIIIHELGHLAAAKAFKVYCLEYSIGMGPAIFKHRGKNKETQFSIRAIPFGGYVSMYGEGVELPEGVVVDESRSLNNIKPWKRAIVLLAGVTMNAVLALVFFFVSNCFPKDYTDYINHLNVAESSIAASAGLSDGGYIKFSEFQYYDSTAETTYVYYMADNTTTFNGDGTVKYATCFYFESPLNPKKLDLADHILFYELKNDPVGLYSKTDVTDYSNKTIYIADNVDNADLAFKLLKDNGVIASYSVEKFNKDNLDYEVASAYHDLKIECVAMTDLYKKVDSDEIAIIPSSYLSIDWNDATVTAYQKLVSDNFVPDFTKYIKPEFTSASVTCTYLIICTARSSTDVNSDV